MKPTFYLRIDSRHKLAVYVWPTVARLRKAWRDSDHSDATGTLAFWRSKRIRISARGSVVSELIGSIHLPLGKFGAGIFAHELQHFMDFWSSCVSGRDNEYLPGIAGRMTSEFWRKYYKRWPRIGDKPV
jgi:hypothetical protein